MTHTFLCSSIILCMQVKFAFHFIKTQMLQLGKGGGVSFHILPVAQNQVLNRLEQKTNGKKSQLLSDEI